MTTDPETTTQPSPTENIEAPIRESGEGTPCEKPSAVRGTGSGGVPDKPIRSDDATQSDR